MDSVVFLYLRQLARETKGHTAEESNYSGCQWPSLWKLGGAFVSTLRLSSEEHSSPKSALQSKTCRRSQFTIALRMSKRGRHLVVQLWQCKYIFVGVLAIGNGSQGKWKSFWESEMYVFQLANILGEKSLIKHKVASLNMPMRWRVHVVQKAMKSIW